MHQPVKNRIDVAEQEVTPPEKCPFCASEEVTTNDKPVSVSAYWRCKKCGEIWNASRLKFPRFRSGYRQPW